MGVSAAAACPSNCLECTVNTASGAVECDTDKCKSGYGLKLSDKTCVSKYCLPLHHSAFLMTTVMR